MSKTATIMGLINSELQKKGNSEFVKDGKLVFFDEDEQFIQKIMKYDEDVEKIVTDKFFKGFTFQNEQTDHDFKKTFVNQFLDREIMFQTVEKFASQVIRLTLQYEKYIENAYEKYQELLTQESLHEDQQDTESNTTQDSTNTTDNRNLRSTLPQDEINMNIENTEMSYADENSIDKQQQKGNETGNQTGKEQGNSKDNNYNVETLKSLQNIFKDIFEIYDRYCFLHVW
ncbi:lower collar protein [Tetragenococcus phage phiYA5_2]|nr:lower collar protein [Tetragenococcus phage phiYA5_2]